MVWWRLICAVVLAAVITSTVTAAPGDVAVGVDHPSADAKYNDVFQAQVAAIVQAYRKHDTTKGRQLIEQFRLPNARDWFAAHLNPARSEELSSRYDRLYENFAASFELTVQDIVAAKGADLGTVVKSADEKPREEDALPGGKRSGVMTTNPVELFFCMFQITVKKTPNVSWGSTFVEQDGAFRYMGNGGWPFWVWQDHPDGGLAKTSHFGTPPTLISRVEPVYPVQARAEKIQGTVVLHILISKEGRVEKAEAVSGDPKLIPAAVDAVRQWRYKPATIGGTVIAIDGNASVVFALR
jgi:TonB family protein